MKNKNLTPISLSETARLLAVSTHTVRRLVDSGDLTAMRIGSAFALSLALPMPLRRANYGSLQWSSANSEPLRGEVS